MRLFAIVLGLVASFAPAARAEPVTFYFEGIVDIAQGPRLADLLLPGVTGADLMGTRIHGWYTFDSEAADVQPTSFAGGYLSSGAPYEFVMHFDHRSFFADNTRIGILNDFDNAQFMPGVLSDSYAVEGYGAPYALSPTLQYRARLDMFAVGTATVGPSTSLVGDDLPLLPPDLAGFGPTRRVFMNVLEDGNVRAGLGGTLTAIYAIPEPGTALLLLLPVAVALAVRRRRPAARSS